MREHEVFFGGVVRYGDTICEVKLLVADDDIFDFLSGQYIWVSIGDERRAFSISSAQHEKKVIQIIFRETESSFKKLLLAKEKGEKIKIIGPFGSSFLLDSAQKPKIFFVAGGVGIAPFASILRSDIGTKDNTVSGLYYCCHNQNDFDFFEKEVAEELSKKKMTIIKKIGTFDLASMPDDFDYENTSYYVSGTQSFVDTVYTELLKKNLKKDQFQFEQFYPTVVGNLTEESFAKDTNNSKILLTAVNDSKSHLVITDANGKIIFANKMAQKNTGYTFEEMLGNTPRLWGGMMTPDFYKSFWKQKKELTGFDGQITNRRKNGEIYQVIAHISPIHGSYGEVVGYIGTEEDISKIIKLEDQLTEDRLRDEALLASMGEGVIAQDKTGKVVFVNSSAEKMLGFTKEELIGKSFVDMVVTETEEGIEIPREKRPMYLASLSKKPVEAALVYIRKDGTGFESSVLITPIYINEKYYGDIQVFSDISERNKEKKRLEKLNQLMVGRELKMIELKKEIVKMRGEVK